MESSTIDTAHTRIDSESDIPSQAVVEAVARDAGVDETDLPPLFHAIDPDALDSLFESGAVARRPSGSVRFSYAGYEVRLSAGGSVAVEAMQGQ